MLVPGNGISGSGTMNTTSEEANGTYTGLDTNTIASMPLESLYRRIEQNLNKTKSFFDIRLTQALKKSEGDLLRHNLKASEETLPDSNQFQKIRARLLNESKNMEGSKSAGRHRTYTITNKCIHKLKKENTLI